MRKPTNEKGEKKRVENYFIFQLCHRTPNAARGSRGAAIVSVQMGRVSGRARGKQSWQCRACPRERAARDAQSNERGGRWRKRWSGAGRRGGRGLPRAGRRCTAKAGCRAALASATSVIRIKRFVGREWERRREEYSEGCGLEGWTLGIRRFSALRNTHHGMVSSRLGDWLTLWVLVGELFHISGAWLARRSVSS
jgi:hypothetical protein